MNLVQLFFPLLLDVIVDPKEIIKDFKQYKSYDRLTFVPFCSVLTTSTFRKTWHSPIFK